MVPVATDKRTMQDSRIPDPEEDDAPGQEQAVAIRPRCVEHTPVLQTVPSALHVVSPTLHAELLKIFCLVDTMRPSIIRVYAELT